MRCASSKLQTRARIFDAEFVPDACALTLWGADFDQLAASNQGAGPIRLTVRGSDESRTVDRSPMSMPISRVGVATSTFGACGSVDAAAGERSLASLDYAKMSLQTDVDTITQLLESAA